MIRNFGFLAPALLALGLVGYACTSGEVVTGPPTMAGAAGTGNPVGSAGTQGNPVGSAGTQGNSAGTNGARGGTTGSAGTNGPRGGTTGSAGTTASRGGTTGSAGTNGSGNAGTNGSGNAGTNGSSSCPTSWDVAANGFVQTPSKGATCWHGYSFTYSETPNCGSTVSPKDFATCTMPCTLMASGTVNSATMANNYCGVVGVGFNIGQDASATSGSNVTPTGTGVNVMWTVSAGSNEFRVNLVDASGMAWCFTVTAPAGGSMMIPYTSFKYQCWSGGTGTPYAKQPFASIAIQSLGGAANQAFSMTLKSVTEY